MARREGIQRALGAAALALGLGLPADVRGAPPSPPGGGRWNVLLLMAEDLSPRLGAFGDPLAYTPHLDRLAAEGTRFERAFTSAGVCAPSRAAMILGVHQNRWGAGDMRAGSPVTPEIEPYAAVPPPAWKAFPELLRAAGYYTVNNGKTDYQLATGLEGTLAFGSGSGGPFTIWDEAHGDDWRGRGPGQPFFAYLTFEASHESQVWPTWQLRGGAMAWLLLPGRVRNHWSWPVETDPAAVSVPPYYPDTPCVRADLVRHYNNIALVDAQVGRVLEELAQDGLADRTVVIFSGDHGDGLPRAKRWLYDSGLRVPLIVRWPGVLAPDSVDRKLVSGVDLAPTILAMAGVERPVWQEGRVIAGPDAGPEPAAIFAARDRMDEATDRVRAARDRRFKYIRHFLPELPYVQDIAFADLMPSMREMRALHAAGQLHGAPALWFRSRRDPEELFDTEADPHEIANRAGDPAFREPLERLRQQLDRWLDAPPGDLGLLPEAELRLRL